MSETESMWLNRFVQVTKCRHVAEIEPKHVAEFKGHMIDQYVTKHTELTALRALRSFLKYYHAQGYPCPSSTAATLACA